MPGCTIMYYLAPPHGKMTGKYVGPVNRNGKDDRKGWAKVHWSDGDSKTHAQSIDKTRLKSNKIAELKAGQWAILDTVQEENVCANALLATDEYLMYKCFKMEVDCYEDDDKLKDSGPITVKQAIKRDDLPMFEEAIDVDFF